MPTPTYTPGPWGWNNRTPGMLLLETRHPAPHLNDPVICAIREDWVGFFAHAEEGQANARLIAAAPDLLEALKDAIAELHNAGYRCDSAERLLASLNPLEENMP